VLDRHGLVTRRKHRRHRAEGTALSRATQPNDLWCADYKGEFMLANRRYCYPLTITDFATRYLITCDALATTQTVYAVTVFERTFREFGLPRAIRTDNGLPFASGHALYGPASCPCGGCGSASSSNASDPDTRAEWPPRADAPHAQAGRHQAPPRPTPCSSKRASTTS
jgi:transposase InsO family protein